MRIDLLLPARHQASRRLKSVFVAACSHESNLLCTTYLSLTFESGCKLRSVHKRPVFPTNCRMISVGNIGRCLPRRRTLCRSFTATCVRQSRARQPKGEINYNPEIYFNDAPNPEHVNYKRVTANDLESYRKPPKQVKMLVRDYIEDSLYNPHYGYFSKQATIVTSPKNIDFGALRDSTEFQEEVARRYTSYGRDEEGPGKQLWHTPTEIFKVGSFSPLDAPNGSSGLYSRIMDKHSRNVLSQSICSSTSHMRTLSSTKLVLETEPLPWIFSTTSETSTRRCTTEHAITSSKLVVVWPSCKRRNYNTSTRASTS